MIHYIKALQPKNQLSVSQYNQKWLKTTQALHKYVNVCCITLHKATDPVRRSIVEGDQTPLVLCIHISTILQQELCHLHIVVASYKTQHRIAIMLY